MDFLASLAPWLSAALEGGPVGVGVLAAKKVADALGLTAVTTDAVKTALSGLTATPEQKLALMQAENSFTVQMRQLGYSHEEQLQKFDIDAMALVNTTIQAELANSANEAWYQKAWRPANGFCVAAGSFVAVVFMCLLFYKAIVEKDVTALNALPQLAIAIATILGVPGAAVGIAAWHRGIQQRIATQKE